MIKNNSRKILKKVLLIGGVMLVAIFLLALTIYFQRPHNRYIRFVEKAFPAVMIDGYQWESFDDFEANVDSTRRFYENQDFSQLGMRVDFNTEDGKKRLKIKEKQVLQKMIEDRAIKIIAQKNGVVVDEATLIENVDKRLEINGNSNSVKERIDRLYGWDLEDFKQKEVAPRLYQEKLETIFEEKYQEKETARRKIEEARREMTEERREFSDVVKDFSEGSSSENRGELGWFRKRDIVPEIAEQIFALEKGAQSQILESSLGFHIIELEDRKTDGEGEMVKIRQIFVAKQNFADWLKNEMQKMKIVILVRGYAWNKETGAVKLTDPKLEEFEQRIMKDPGGDASAMF